MLNWQVATVEEHRTEAHLVVRQVELLHVLEAIWRAKQVRDLHHPRRHHPLVYVACVVDISMI